MRANAGEGARTLRIVYVVDVFPLATETFIVNELLELARRGVELRILALRRPQEDVGRQHVAGSGLDALTCYERDAFAGIVGAFRPALLHAHFATAPTAVALELARGHGMPFTFAAHGYDVYRRPPADWAARARAAARVVTVAEANARHLATAFGVPRSHIAVIRNGVDHHRFRPAPAAAGQADLPPLVACVARHEPVKNLDVLLDACALLQRRGVAFRCVLIGDGSCRGALEARCRSLGLDRACTFTGALPSAAVLAWLQQAALAVLTSDSEGLPVSLIEAGACALPAVATAVGGIPELIEPEVTGLLVPPRDPVAVADAIASLLAAPARAAAMGAAARRRVEAEFTLRRQVDELLALWCAILRPTPSAAARETAS